MKPTSKTSVLLTDKDRTLLLKVSNLHEEIIETLDILEDKETMKSIKQAEEDSKQEESEATRTSPRSSNSSHYNILVEEGIRRCPPSSFEIYFLSLQNATC